MAVTAKKFEPNATPETWMDPPVNGCRISTLLTAARFQTLDDRFTNPNGTIFGQTKRMNMMEKLRRYASEHRGQSVSEAEAYDRDDALYAYDKMFPGLEAISVNPTPLQMKRLLKDGWFLSVSGNVRHTSAKSKLRENVNPVGHEIGVARLDPAGTKALVYEPMTPYRPIRVDWSDVVAFSREFKSESGARVAIKFKIGKYTALAKTTEELANKKKALQDKKKDLKDARDALDAAQSEVASLSDALKASQAEIARLNEVVSGLPDDGDTTRRDALNDAITAIEKLRDEGAQPG